MSIFMAHKEKNNRQEIYNCEFYCFIDICCHYNDVMRHGKFHGP